jgi:hypothetical protein
MYPYCPNHTYVLYPFSFFVQGEQMIFGIRKLKRGLFFANFYPDDVASMVIVNGNNDRI